jgi:ABC-2 type transport system ATP-binding protein
MNALEVIDLKKSFKKQVLAGISFAVEKGSVTGFIGANGSGKTTTLKCLFRFIYPQSGTILFFGENKMTAQMKQKIGFLPERPYLPGFLTLQQMLRYHWRLSGGGEGFEERADQIIRQVDLAEHRHRRLAAFSKGMQQRAALAQALLRRPEFIILDEPMSGLDPDGRVIVKNIIKEEHERGATIFFSSHLLSDMDELCTHVVMLHSGKVIYSGAVDQLTQVSSDTFQISYSKPQQAVARAEVSKDRLQAEIAGLLAAGFEIVRVEPLHRSIESVYVAMREKLK